MSRPFAYFAFLTLLMSQQVLAQTHLIRIAVPVTWQLTHTHISGPVAPSLTESFREIWRLEVAPSGMLTLSSPRAKVIAYGLSGRVPQTPVPHRLAVSEWDFARLVGIQPISIYETEDIEGSGMASRPVFFNLGGDKRGGSDIYLFWSDEENYSIHLDVAPEG